MHGICEGDKINDKICGDDIDLDEQAETRSITGSVNCNGDSFSVFDAFTFPGDNVYDIFENEDKINTEGSIVWVNTNNLFWEGRVIKINYSDFPHDSNYLKLIWINTKKEDRFLIKNCFRECKQKIIPISNHKYKDGGVMEKSLLGITIKIRNQKKGMTTTKVKYVDGNFVVKLSGLNIQNNFLNTVTSK